MGNKSIPDYVLPPHSNMHKGMCNKLAGMEWSDKGGIFFSLDIGLHRYFWNASKVGYIGLILISSVQRSGRIPWFGFGSNLQVNLVSTLRSRPCGLGSLQRYWLSPAWELVGSIEGKIAIFPKLYKKSRFF